MLGFASLCIRVALLASLSLFAATPLAQQRVGVSGAVNPEATGILPGAAPKRLVIGEDVIFNERITTTETGQTQLLFLDESSMTVGPNSDLTIDQFVYDPKSGTGGLAMSATRGLLRYVGGKLSKQDEGVTVRTKTATMTVRGGAFFLAIERDGTTEAVFISGERLQVTALDGISQTLTRPGFQITIAPGGTALSPAPVPPGQLAQFVRQLDGRIGDTGGATVIPTDAAVANSGVAQTISGNLPQTLQPRVIIANTQQVITSQESTAPTCAIAATCSSSAAQFISPIVTPPPPRLAGPPGGPPPTLTMPITLPGPPGGPPPAVAAPVSALASRLR